ncbi:gustatory receptor for sugar taste 64a-like [Leptidea sinapis]|uniref:gustatory receptor for sugar taste 64a-like n=1 Tax=Leptidea sinapis TaxID=189913 RepID=UPI0021C34D6C|nr:gustatory receptor for sugar taste 64a-like [Leptidea sinapis]
MEKVFHASRWIGIPNTSAFWKLWACCVIFLMVSVEIGAIRKVIRALAGWAVDTSKQRSVTARLAGAMFYAMSVISQILCWRLAQSWSQLSKTWAATEWTLSIKYVPPDVTLRRRLLVVTAFIMIGGLGEHVLSILAAINDEFQNPDLLRTYILKSHGFLFLEKEYHPAFGVAVFFISNLATILWNFQDLVIVLTSMGLTSRYYRLNICIAMLISRQKEKKTDQDIQILRLYLWRKIREAFVRQATLARKVDETLGLLILFSNFFNFYFICLQLFLGITLGVTGEPLQQTYYLVSLCWICIRSSCVVLAASDVNQHSNKALTYLCDCLPYQYNIEIERLQVQLRKDYIALSGMGFFYLTRSVLLKVASSVITYVLVLVQYDGTDRIDGKWLNSTSNNTDVNN